MIEQNYLSDEELFSLMDSVESSPMHTAPPYIKEKILRQAARTQISNTVMTSIPKKHELFLFSAKVVAAAAAAIALLIVMPGVQQMEQIQMQIQSQNIHENTAAPYEEKDPLLRKFNDGANQFFRQFSKKADAIFFKEDK